MVDIDIYMYGGACENDYPEPKTVESFVICTIMMLYL